MAGGPLDPLFQVFEENTIVWILVSLGLGGTVTAVVNYLFQNYLPEWQRRRAVRAAAQKYSVPIMESARRLSYIISKVTDLQNVQIDEEGRLSILYELGSLLGWIKILQNETTEQAVESTVELKVSLIVKFYRYLDEFLSNLSLLIYYAKKQDTSTYSLLNTKNSLRIPSKVLNAIGELMITTDSENNSSTIIKFTDFARTYGTSPDFKRWFSHFDNIFIKLRKVRASHEWNELIMLQVFLALLILSQSIKESTIPKSWFSPQTNLQISRLIWLPSKIATHFRMIKMMNSVYRSDRKLLPQAIKDMLGKQKREINLETELAEIENDDHLKYYDIHVLSHHNGGLRYYINHGLNGIILLEAATSIKYLHSNFVQNKILEHLRGELDRFGCLSIFDDAYHDMLSYFEDHINENHGNVEVWTKKGLVLVVMGKYTEANTCFETAIKLNSDFGDPLVSKGLLEMSLHFDSFQTYEEREKEKKRKLETAIACFEKVLPLTTSSPLGLSTILKSDANIWNNIGICNFGLGNYEEATKCFQRSAELDSNQILAKHNEEIARNKVKRQNDI